MRIAPVRRQSRSVSVVYGTVTAALLVAVATVALVVAPPAPPSVAEFAPSADSTIDEAPEGQSSRFGAGDGNCPPGVLGCEGVTTTTAPGGGKGGAGGTGATTTTVAYEVSRIKRCVGDPPRQIEDPQSPPCADYFNGENPGATARGVTRDEIVVAVPRNNVERYEAYLPFFNNRFELYRRRIRLVPYGSSGVPPTENTPPERLKAIAQEAAQTGAFVALLHDNGAVGEIPEELARQGVLSVGSTTSVSEADLRSMHPYAWSYRVPVDATLRAPGELACRGLRGRPARFGGPDVEGTTRKFHIVKTKSGRFDPAPLQAALRRCGIEAGASELRGNGAPPPAPEDGLLAADLRERGVTTVFLLGHSPALAEFMRHASTAGWQPEWVIPGNFGQELELFWQSAPVEQRAHLFGLTTLNKGLPMEDSPWHWALREASPDGETPTAVSYTFLDHIYRQMLLTTSGLQAAGPNLTPETFARGLQGLRFPNPDAGAAPYFQAHVGFAGDHAMIDDFGLVWWSETAKPTSSRASETGGWCYVERGKRYRPGAFPDREPDFFSGPCT